MKAKRKSFSLMDRERLRDVARVATEEAAGLLTQGVARRLALRYGLQGIAIGVCLGFALAALVFSAIGF